jgi:hypothetical protein
MKIRHKALLLLVTLIGIVLPTHAQLSAPKYSNEFLQIGVGARAQGMSLSQVAMVDDVTSGYSEYFAGIAKYDYAAIAKRLDSSSVAAISFVRFGVDDIPNTTELIDAGGNIDYDRITTFSAADYGFILSYGRNGFPGVKANPNARSGPQRQGWSWGVNAKIIYRQVGSFANAWGFGLDAGAQYYKAKWKFGAIVRDVTSTFNAWSYSLDDRTKEIFAITGNEIPTNGLEVTLPRIILGVGRVFQSKKITISPEINLNLTTDGKRNVLIAANPVSIDPSLGFEIGYNRTIFFRGGVGNGTRVTNFDGSTSYTFQPNIGLGLRLKSLYIDYALSDIGNVSDVLYSNVFSLRYDIFKGGKK